MAQVIGGDKLRDAMRQIADRVKAKREVRVGFIDGATYPDGTTVATVAALNEFGAPAAGIPPRPFFSGMIRDKKGGWGDAMAAQLKATGYDIEVTLERMGLGIAGQLREAIEAFDQVPNSPVTDLLKQRFPTGDGVTFADVQQARADVAAGETAPSGKPLVWSGHLLASVGSEVE